MTIINNITLSIIIPVYNVEKYLEECIKSIINQMNNSVEIILIDDGSTDKSGNICDKYTRKFIRVIHQENRGLAGARNSGLKLAKGKYIAFIDSDDYIAENVLKKIIDKIKRVEYQSDIIFMEGIKFYPDGKKISLGDGYDSNKFSDKNKEKILKHIASISKLPVSACTKILRRDFLFQNNLFFVEGLLSEDVEWFLRVISCANTFDYFNEPYYYYRQNRSDSITNTVKFKNLSGIIYALNYWGRNNNEFKKKYCLSLLSYEYIMLLVGLNMIEDDKKDKLYDVLKKYQYIMNYGKYKKVKIVNLLLKLLGIRLTSRLLFVYRKRGC